MGDLRNIGRQLDNIEKQAAERNETAGAAGSSLCTVLGGVLRPGITPHQELSAQPQLQPRLLLAQKQQNLEEQEHQPQPLSQHEESESIARHIGRLNRAPVAQGKVSVDALFRFAC